MKNKKEVGKALGRVASGLYVITAKFEDKEDAVLASWVNQCSFDPPAVLSTAAFAMHGPPSVSRPHAPPSGPRSA